MFTSMTHYDNSEEDKSQVHDINSLAPGRFEQNFR